MLISFFQTSGQQKLKPKKKGGGPAPTTQDNTTILQSGDNNRFPSGRNSTVDNPILERNKKPAKKKMEERAKYQGEDEQKKTQKHTNPNIEKGGNYGQIDHKEYKKERQNSMESLEKPNAPMHEFKGDVAVKKKDPLRDAPENVDHKNRKSEMVDHSKYQSYRKKAFEKKESDMEHLNSQGTAQYGIREEHNVDLEKRKAVRQSKDRERFEYSGDQLPKTFKPSGEIYSGDIEVKGENKQIKEAERNRANYSGDVDAGDGLKKRQVKEQEIANYQGDVNLGDRDNLRKEKDKEQAEYSGDYVAKNDKLRREKDKESANYTGDIDLGNRDKMRREKDKQMAESSGDISVNALMKKAREIRKKEKAVSKYSGDILVKTLHERDNKIRIKAKKIANWEGDVVVYKKKKGAHPSAAYRGGKVANSYKAKEKYRKKMLKKYGRNADMETPNYQKQKYTKPGYDKDESKIWDVQKYKEGKTKETP